MELFDLYDRQNNKLNKTMVRGSKNLEGEYHKVVHIWVKNSKGEYLVQQRNKTTDTIPYQWAPTAGSITVGETEEIGAIRETYEEIGLELKESDLIHKGRIFREHHISNYVIEIYLVEKDVDLSTLTIDPIEVKDIAYFTKEEIYNMIEAKRFWDFRDIKDYFSQLEKSN